MARDTAFLRPLRFFSSGKRHPRKGKFQLYRSHTSILSESSDTSSSGFSSTIGSPQNILCSVSSLPHTLDDLLAGLSVPKKDARKPPPSRPLLSSNPSVPVDLDMSDGETSISDSGSESPVCVELPPQPFIHEHTVNCISAQVSWSGPRNGELVSFYELQLQEARLDGQGKNIHWFCSKTEEHLDNLTPDTAYLLRIRALNVAGAGKWSAPYRFGTMPPVAGMPLDPSPVTVTVRRCRKPQKKTIFFPAP
ncbi:fibronectin type III domain-containing protein 8 [Rhineura floridana]|uniref:fibronectin type III domain-containing protein 8 n=1 Tax=Rhineura floridana TaxID=261503 RepID=UPI002AC843D1|nr:fibronectin type III domain-containing protein 8 [Rhineura floridana]